MQEAFREAGAKCDLFIVSDGAGALEFIKRKGRHPTAPRPNLIILDLNLPGKNGREILAEVRKNPQCEHIPILVFSNSESHKDICESYANGANLYLNKPSDFQNHVTFAKTIDLFWLQLGRYCTH